MKRLIRFLAFGLCLGAAHALALAESCGPVQIQRSGANVILTWNPASCQLQATSDLGPPIWMDLPGASPPFVLAVTGGQRFFRTVSSDGQSCSPNVVGYVNVLVPSGGTNLLSNPLNGTNNSLNTILPLPAGSDGAAIFRFDATIQNYRDPCEWFDDFGWFSASDPNPTIHPGEGFWFRNIAGTPLNLTFIGEVPQGNLVNPLPSGLSIKSSIVPQTASLTSLGFPAEDGDVVKVFDPAAQQFKEPYQFIDGFGWISSNPDDPGPNGPVIPVGVGFWVEKAGPAAAWSRIFDISAKCSGCAPPSVTLQPQDQTVADCSCVTFSVGAMGTPPLTYQWYKDGSPISGANASAFTICPVSLADAGQYFVRVVNPCGSVDSRTATLTVQPDTTPPTLVSAYADCDSRVYAVFSERMEPSSVEELFNYSLPGVVINSASLLADGRTVCLSTSQLTPGASYTLTVSNVRDACGNNVINPNPSMVSFTAPECIKGYILREWWFNIAGTAVSALTGDSRYPNSPDLRCYTNLFELNSADMAENYGARMSASFCPPASGNYIFYLAADDNAQLYLSTDENCANKVLIATEPQFAGRREWTGNAGGRRPGLENVSQPIALQAGLKYCIEALMKENGGADHLAVAVQLPGDPVPAIGSTPIPGQYLGACISADDSTLTIVKQPANVTVSACCTNAMFMVGATGTGACGLAITYEWQRDGITIPGANGPIYTTPTVSLADDSAQFRVIVRLGGRTVVSQIAILTVAADTTPPVLLFVDCISNKFTLVFSDCLDRDTAADSLNYQINGGTVGIQSVSVSEDGKVVCLFSDSLDAQTDYTITASGLWDQCGNVAADLTVTVRCPCLNIQHEQLTCVTNGPAKLNYSFDLQNVTGVPVKYLFLVPKTNCFTFMPEIFTFKPPLLPGQTTNVSAMINLSTDCPTNLCFLVAAHDSNLVQCCSIMHCVDRNAGPRLVSATASCGTNKITVKFDVPLDPASFLDVPNFIVDDLTHHVSLLFAGTTFGPDFQTVCLYTLGPLSSGTQYRLTVNNVQDTCGHVIAPNSQVGFSCPDDPPKLNFTFSDGRLCLSWTGSAVLECATSLTSPINWAPAADQSNPQCIVPTGTQKFFRLRRN
jgi:hypothetical protein